MPDTGDEYASSIDNLQEKLSVFEKDKVAIAEVSSNICTLQTASNPLDLAVHKLGTVFYNNGESDIPVERVEKEDLHYIETNPKLKFTSKRPVYVRRTNNVLLLFPTSPVGSDGASRPYSTSNVSFNYIEKPTDPKWTYVVVGGKALYNGSDAGKQDFELHASEESTLVNKILELAGIAINRPDISELILRNQALKEAKENR